MSKNNNNKRKRKSGDKSPSPCKRRRQNNSYWIESSGSSDSYNRVDIVKNARITIEITRVELDDDLLLSNAELKLSNVEECNKIVSLNNATDTGKVVEDCNGIITPSDDTSIAENDTEENLKLGARPDQKVQVLRHPSAVGKIKIKKNGYNNLPDGDCGDGVANPHPKTEVQDKYWAQRRRLFSRFDSGIQLDSQGWYSTTPEVIANHTAEQAIKMGNMYPSETANGLIILDAFCGCGGNAIAFAKHKNISFVIAVDNDPQKIKMAEHNALLYDIPKDKILFLEADAFEVMNCYTNGTINSEAHRSSISKEQILPTNIDVIFLSPPWGGPSYLQKQSFDFISDTKLISSADSKTTKNGMHLLQAAAKSARHQMIILFLPRNTNGTKIAKTASSLGYNDGSVIEMEQNVVNGKLKAITAYFSQNGSTL